MNEDMIISLIEALEIALDHMEYKEWDAVYNKVVSVQKALEVLLPKEVTK